jgi:type VI protein secretion system component VasK
MNIKKSYFFLLFFLTLFLLIWTVSVVNSNETGYTWQDYAIFLTFGIFAFILLLYSIIGKWKNANHSSSRLFSSPPDNEGKDAEKSMHNLGEKFSLDLFHWEREIKSPRIKESLSKLVGLFGTVIKMEDEAAAEKFYGRYAENINNLLSKYDKLEEAQLQSDDANQTMTDLENTLEQIVVALRNEINSTYKYDLQTINAESKAFLQSLRNRGLLD